MKKYLLIIVAVIGLGFPFVSKAAAGDIVGVRINSEGWYAEVDIDGFVTGGTADLGLINDDIATTIDNNAALAKMVFNVTSQGYDANGTLGTITRKVYGTKLIRKAYPNQASLDEAVNGGVLTVKVALSDYVYNDDKNGGAGTSGTDVTVSMPTGWYRNTGSGGNSASSTAVTNMTVTNNSAMDYPKVIARFAWPGYEKVSSDFLVESVAFHRSARNGKPVAAVAYSAADQSGNKTYATSTAMTVSTRTGDVNKVLVYAATLDIDALTQAQNIDVNFIAYPWIGDEDSKFNTASGTDGYAQPDERGGTLYFVNDKNGTYGTGYALVSPTGTTTGQVYSSQSAAESGTAFLTIGAAAVAIKNFHNNASTTSPVRNSAGGGVILLAEGNYNYPGTIPGSDLGTMNTWLTIKPASTAARANTKISSGTNSDLKATRVKIEGITVSPSAASGGGLTGRTAGDVLWLHNNIINATSTLPLFNWRMGYATQNSVTALTNGFAANYGGYRGPFVLVRGNDAAQLTSSHVYTVLGNKNVMPDKYTEAPNSPGHAASNNSITAFNAVYGLQVNFSISNTNPADNVALIQNLFERTGSSPTGVMDISSAGGNGSTTNNVLAWHNTFVGERVQWAYNSSGSTRVLKSNFSNRFNIFGDQGTKSDTFTGAGGGNGNRTGNWSIVYNVGTIGDKSLKNTFPGDFDGLYSQRPHTNGSITLGFVSDKSRQSGTDQGNGDYQLISTSTAIDVASIDQSLYEVLPYDLLGNTRYGSPDSGAYEYQPPYTMGSDRISTSSTARVYGDEKFRMKSGSVSPTGADISVGLPGSDSLQSLDLTVTTWSNSGTHHKVWTEMSSSTGLTNTTHVIGDLEAGKNYAVKLDGVVGQNITGANCTSGICLSDSNGKITFTYTGTYSLHTFDVEESETPPPPPPPDTTAPQVIMSLPSGDLSFGTTETTLSITTNEPASCKYGTVAETAYADIANTFAQTATTSHTALLSGLTNHTSYNYYVRCQDAAENASTTDYVVSFAISSSSDVIAPHITSISYNKPTASTTIAITVNFSEAVTSTGNISLTTSTTGVCSATVSNASSTTCYYEFGSENISGFSVVGISGTVKDAGENALTGFVSDEWTTKTESY